MANYYLDSGKAITSGLVSALTSLVPKYIGIGTGAGPTASTATALTTEVETRATGTVTRAQTTVANDSMVIDGTITLGTARVLTEWMIFDASTVGNAFIGGTQTSLSLASGDSIRIVATIKWA